MEFIRQLKWQLLIFQRNNLIAMIIAITAFYMLVLYLLRDLGDIERVTTLLIFNEPSMTGFVFIGLAIILERDQDVFSALFVSPLSHHVYLASRVVVLSLLSLIGAFGMVLIAKGISFSVLHFTVGVFSSCVLFSFVGIFVVSFTSDILQYILRSVPVILVMSLPFFNYFGFTDIGLLKLFPVQGSLYLISNSFHPPGDTFELLAGYASVAVWTPLLYWLVFRTFRKKRIEA